MTHDWASLPPQPLWIDTDEGGSVTLTWATEMGRFWFMVTPGGNDKDSNGWGWLVKTGDGMDTEMGVLSDDAYNFFMQGATQWEQPEIEDED